MLPFESKVEEILVSHKVANLQKAYEELSASYRKKEHSKRFMQNLEHRLSYMAVRMPATYAVCLNVVRKLSLKTRTIQSFLDLGAGFGALSWAMEHEYPGCKKKLLEQDVETIALGKKLGLPNGDWHLGDFRQLEKQCVSDAVGLSYALSEVEPEARAKILSDAWCLAGQYLLLIEPGTPEGFQIIAQARQQLIGEGAFVIAPCTHQRACPMTSGESWCHFSQYVARTKTHMEIKRTTLPYEHEKFSYVIFSREPVSHVVNAGRIIASPLKRRGHVLIDQCSAQGIERLTIAQRDKKAFKKAKKTAWGDIWAD